MTRSIRNFLATHNLLAVSATRREVAMNVEQELDTTLLADLNSILNYQAVKFPNREEFTGKEEADRLHDLGGKVAGTLTFPRAQPQHFAFLLAYGLGSGVSAAASLWGTVKPSQWYGIYALAGAADQIFTLKAMPVLRVASVAGQVISLRNNGNSANVGYGFGVDELAGGQILALTGASRGLARSITANNGDNSTGGTVTYDGAALALAQGDWFVVLPEANFCHLGMVFAGSDGTLAPFYQEGRRMAYAAPALLSSGALNGFTLLDLGLTAPPTARRLWGFAAATNGYDLKLAVSYDGSNPALLLHGTPPTLVFQGVRGAAPFSCLIPAGHQLYLNNDNTANQTVKITGWQE